MGQWAMGQWENGLLGWEERSILYYFELQRAFSKRGASYAILGFFFLSSESRNRVDLTLWS
jgi:hypothetical protein